MASWSLSVRIHPGKDWLLLNCLGETKWRHQSHISCWCLVKDNGQCYCSSGSTLDRQSFHWNLPELQTARFVKRWCLPFLISPQFSILWPVIHLGSWCQRPYGHHIVYELKAYFGFFRLQRTCETIPRFYTYDGTTNYVRCRTGTFQTSRKFQRAYGFLSRYPPSLGPHFWLPEIKGLAYNDDGNIIVKLRHQVHLNVVDEDLHWVRWHGGHLVDMVATSRPSLVKTSFFTIYQITEVALLTKKLYCLPKIFITCCHFLILLSLTEVQGYPLEGFLY